VQIKQGLLCEVASAAYYLDIKPLVNLTSRAIASQISTKTSEELRETFSNVNCDLYVPMFATRCRLHRKMAQKKSVKGIQDSCPTENGTPLYQYPTCSHPPNAPHTVECCTLPLPPSASQQPSLSPSCSSSSTSSSSSSSTEVHDTRSLDELLEFIGDDGKSSKKGKKKPKKAKRNEGKKDSESKKNAKQAKVSSTIEETTEETTEETKEETTTEEEDSREEELSPEIQAEIDREVEEFRLRLESMSRNKRTIPKITLPSAISASLSSLQVY
jgi:hypothetical protein